jgi:hypothetical protein
MRLRHAPRGMSFMDVIIGTALMLLIFTALVGLLRSSLQVAAVAKTRSIATAVAESQMEYVRSLSYDSVGTVGGIPAGEIPQYATTTSNGIDFPTRTFIEYVDDPADGTGEDDVTGIITDYKRIKVSVSYFANNHQQTIDLVSNYAPPDLETTTNGGTLKIGVVNAGGSGVPGASVRIFNTSASPSVDITTFSDSTGTVFLPGAPTSTEYQIAVSKSGYSSAQTYTRDATNQNPNPGYLTVVKNQTTTGTFAIDLLATLSIKTWYPIATSTFSDTFTASGDIASQSNAAVSGGGVQLANAGTGYAPSGSVTSVAQAPTYLASWGIVAATTTQPAGTSVRFHVVDGSGSLLPDTAVPGNASGFTGSADLSAVSTTTYPSLALSADLTTSSTTTTPVLESWSLSYSRGPIPFPSVPFTLSGTKTVGSTGAGDPIYKTTVADSTDSSGASSQSLEWDAYSLSLSSYDTVSACLSEPPYTLSPGSSLSSSLYLASSTPNMVLVTVRAAGAAVPDASVTVAGGSYSKTLDTDACGSAYFGALSSGSYSISASKTGYTTVNATGVTVSGHLFYPVALE